LPHLLLFSRTPTTALYTLSLHDALPISQGLPRTGRQQRVDPHGGHEHQVRHEHRVQGPRQPHAREAYEREPCSQPQGPPGPEDHAVGTSVLSRIALRAASAVTPSSSSSGATLTRWRRTAGASAFTSSGMT